MRLPPNRSSVKSRVLQVLMDCKIDGVVTDVKSVSTYGFKKFKDGTLAYDDPFGYVAQIKGYAYSEGQTSFGWLSNGQTERSLDVPDVRSGGLRPCVRKDQVTTSQTALNMYKRWSNKQSHQSTVMSQKQTVRVVT